MRNCIHFGGNAVSCEELKKKKKMGRKKKNKKRRWKEKEEEGEVLRSNRIVEFVSTSPQRVCPYILFHTFESNPLLVLSSGNAATC